MKALWSPWLFRRSVVCPIIDVISDETFEYMAGSDMTYGGFNWKLNFRWYPVPQREMDRRKGDRTLPLRCTQDTYLYLCPCWNVFLCTERICLRPKWHPIDFIVHYFCKSRALQYIGIRVPFGMHTLLSQCSQARGWWITVSKERTVTLKNSLLKISSDKTNVSSSVVISAENRLFEMPGKLQSWHHWCGFL